MDVLDQFSPAFLHQLLDYNPVTGACIWNARYPGDSWHDKVWNTNYANNPAGWWATDSTTGNKYLTLIIGGKTCKANRVFWKMTYWETPEGVVDHADRDTTNNRIRNFRVASHVESSRNRGRRSDNLSGVTGVYYLAARDRWVATITLNKRQQSIGHFRSKEAAVKARLAAELEHYGEFSPNHKGLK